MTREQARENINNLISIELVKAKKMISGYDTYICPFCGNGSGKNGTGISTKDGKHYTCFKGCFTSLDYLDILKQQHGTKNEDNIFRLYNLTPADGRAETSIQPKTNHKDFFLQAQKVLNTSSEALKYLEGRGISLETATRFMLGYCPDWRSPTALKNGKNPPPSPRIIIPTSRYSYLARDISPDANKSFKTMKEGAVSFFNSNVLQKNEPIFITEGEFDAISIAEVGGQGIALGSISNIEKFIELCRTKPPVAPLILSLDNDEPGRKAQEKLKAGLEALKIKVYEINTAGEYKDPNEHLISSRTAFMELVNSDPTEKARLEAEAEKLKYLETSATYHIADFMGAIGARLNISAISTGFTELDTALDGGLYEGLYIMGAISSLGKTTLILQIADQIAQQGQDVLIFSLEMSRFELMAKSISRLTLLNCNGKTKNAKTTRGILAGEKRKYYTEQEKELINKSISDYAEYGSCLYIHEGIGDIGVEQIKQEVQKHISFTGNEPVVVIDYLQILAPFDMRASDKQNTDKAVLELKRLSRDKKIPVIAISSFNRENYSTRVNLSSFKESGAIEYSSDVLLGLQFEGMDELAGNAGNNAKKVEEMKNRDPRKVQLKILKNRNGRAGINLYYDYYPMFNLFKEITKKDDISETELKTR